MIAKAQENPLVQMAGMIARMFRIDPIVVLKSTWEEWAIRTAAFQHVSEIEKKASESNKRKQPDIPKHLH